MTTDLTALRASLLERIDAASRWYVDGNEESMAVGAILSGLSAAIAAVRVELDREREATASLPPVEAPAADDEWTLPPVQTVWGRAEWYTTSGAVHELYVVEVSGCGDYIARISAHEWCAYQGPEGCDGVIDRGDAASLRDAHAQAIAALRDAGSLA